MIKIKVRKFQPADLEDVQHLFRGTVHAINAKDYSQKQLDAWAPEKPSSTWDSLQDNICVVAEINGTIVGFGDLTKEGYLDRLYAHKDFQSLGIGTQILGRLEQKAKKLGLKEIYTESSLTAKSFFEHHGFIVLKEQEKTLRGEPIKNIVMLKSLAKTGTT